MGVVPNLHFRSIRKAKGRKDKILAIIPDLKPGLHFFFECNYVYLLFFIPKIVELCAFFKYVTLIHGQKCVINT
jgi:hypothetical protein